LSKVCYIPAPEELTTDGKVLADLSLSGFGWVAVSMSAISEAAQGSSIQRSKLTVRVYGPPSLNTTVCEYPMPIAGLPGEVTLAAEDEDVSGTEDRLDEDDQDVEDDTINEEVKKPEELPDQPWAEGLGRAVGGYTRAAPGGGKTGADKDEAVAAEVIGSTLRRPAVLNEEFPDDDEQADAMIKESIEDSQFGMPVDKLDDSALPFDDFDESGSSGPSPERTPGKGGSSQAPKGDPWAGAWPGVSSMESAFESFEPLEQPTATKEKSGRRDDRNGQSAAEKPDGDVGPNAQKGKRPVLSSGGDGPMRRRVRTG